MLEEEPAFPAPCTDPLWSSLRVNPYCWGYLGSVEGQKRYESTWQALRNLFTGKDLEPSKSDDGYLTCETVVHAEWHEPTWERPRVESGSETFNVRKDLVISKAAIPRILRCPPQNLKDSTTKKRPPGRVRHVHLRDAHITDLGQAQCEKKLTSPVLGMHMWEPASLWNVIQVLAKSDLIGLGRLRCTCKELAKNYNYIGRTPVPEYNPLISVSTAYLVEVPVYGGQIYFGSFALPMKASDFPSLQNWFSSAMCGGELRGACHILCSVMPNCFEFDAGCGLMPQAVDGFHALQEVLAVSGPVTLRAGTIGYSYYAHKAVSLWTT